MLHPFCRNWVCWIELEVNLAQNAGESETCNYSRNSMHNLNTSAYLRQQTLQELRRLSSVTFNCQVTKIVMMSGSQLSKLSSMSWRPQISWINVLIDKNLKKCHWILGNFLTFNDMSCVPKSKSGSVSDNATYPQTLSGQLKNSWWIFRIDFFVLVLLRGCWFCQKFTLFGICGALNADRPAANVIAFLG